MYRSPWDVQSCHLARLREHPVRLQEPLAAGVGESRNLQQDLIVQHLTVFRWVFARQHLPSSPSLLLSYVSGKKLYRFGLSWTELLPLKMLR